MVIKLKYGPAVSPGVKTDEPGLFFWAMDRGINRLQVQFLEAKPSRLTGLTPKVKNSYD